MTREDEMTAPALPIPGSVNAMLSDLLWEVAAYVELLCEAELADLPISTASSGMLMTVYAEPGVTVAEIARRKPKSAQAISQIVARLEKLGLVERRLRQGRGVGLHLRKSARRCVRSARRRTSRTRSSTSQAASRHSSRARTSWSTAD